MCRLSCLLAMLVVFLVATMSSPTSAIPYAAKEVYAALEDIRLEDIRLEDVVYWPDGRR